MPPCARCLVRAGQAVLQPVLRRRRGDSTSEGACRPARRASGRQRSCPRISVRDRPRGIRRTGLRGLRTGRGGTRGGRGETVTGAALERHPGRVPGRGGRRAACWPGCGRWCRRPGGASGDVRGGSTLQALVQHLPPGARLLVVVNAPPMPGAYAIVKGVLGERGRIVMRGDVSDDHAFGEPLTSLLGCAAEPATQQS
jgi:hypothetical protein